MPPENLIERVVRVLSKYPSVQFQRHDDSIEVPAASSGGFHVSISAESGSPIVHYEGWHEDFDNDDEALNCFMIGLTPEVRLRVSRRGECDCTWTPEIRENGRWVESSTVGLLLFPFWRRKQVLLLQNRWIEAPRPIE